MKWISVKDKLPDFEEDILFTDGNNIYFGEYNSRDKTKYYSLSNTNVDHWNDEEVNRKTCGFISDCECYGPIDSDAITYWAKWPSLPKD